MPAHATATTAWLRFPAPRPEARMRLICFHAAGSGPAMYRRWPGGLPEDVEVLLVQLPGRENRMGQPLLTEYPEVVEQLRDALAPFVDRPYALFGHSMGALLAYGVAAALRDAGLRTPERLLVSGSAAPGVRSGRTSDLDWTDAGLTESLRKNGGTPVELFDHPDFLAMVLPVLRADYTICRTVTKPVGPLLDCPVSVFGGLEDCISTEQLWTWAALTSAPTTVRTLPGGHFFLSGPSEPEVLAAVSDDLILSPERPHVS